MKLKVLKSEDTPKNCVRRIVLKHDKNGEWVRDTQDCVFMLWSNSRNRVGDCVWDPVLKRRVEVDSPFEEILDEDGYGTGERRIKEGLIAFPVDVYEHGGTEWALSGEGGVRFSCPWDAAHGAFYLYVDKKRWDSLCGNCEWKFADGKPTDADLLSGCTIAVDGYRDAVVRACENAQVLGAARGDTVKLGVEVAEMPQGLAGTDDKDAQVQAKITLAVVTMDENARVTSAIGDMTEPELTVSADGTVSAPREPVYTKNELGDRYGMRSASALGKEWYEHSAGWCGYLKGKNAVEIGKLSADGTDADLKALCTISVTELQKATLKAMAEP